MCCAKACYLSLPCQKSKCLILSGLQFMCYARACCLHLPHQQLECSMFFGLLQVTMVLISFVFSAFIILVKCLHVTHHLGIIVTWVLFVCFFCLSLKPNVVCVCHWSGVLHVVPISNPLQMIFQRYYSCSSLELSIVHIYH